MPTTTSAERMRAYRARLKAEGLKIHQILAPDCEPAVLALQLCAAELKFLADKGMLTEPVLVRLIPQKP